MKFEVFRSLVLSLLLLFVFTCSSSDSDLADVDAELEEVAHLLNQDLKDIRKNSNKGEELLSKYFKKDGSFDSTLLEEKGLADQSKRQRRIAYLYLSTLLGKMGLSLLEILVDMISVGMGGEEKPDGEAAAEGAPPDQNNTFAQLAKFIPGDLKTKESIDNNLKDLNMVFNVVEKNFSLQTCLNLVGKDIDTCCSRLVDETDDQFKEEVKEECENDAQEIVDARPDDYDTNDDIRSAQNKGLTSLATVSCFTSIIRATAISTTSMAGFLTDMSGEGGGEISGTPEEEGSAPVIDPTKLADGLGDIGKILSDLKGAALFISDMTNLTTKSCIDSGLIPEDNPFVQNMKKLKTQIDDKVKQLEAIEGLGSGEALEKAVELFFTEQFGLRCNTDTGKDCCKVTGPADPNEPDGQTCLEKYPNSALDVGNLDQSALPEGLSDQLPEGE